ncbi:MAG: 50S ribosomal protein L2 [Lentisphaeria bacterium]|nr:50S ribosomal protein L2 [Lentisphaerota bacterium]MBO5695815.1 50S ribosomal protein L2 [Lentisphaeria bacterium]
MAIKSFKPFTKSRRFTTVLDYSELSDVAPEKSLTVGLKKTGGRNNMGRVTTRFRGGGNKRIYRKVDFKRNKFDVTAEVKTIEYDPNRSAFIALIEYADGVKSYILATNGMKVGQIVSNGPNAEIKAGNAMPLRSIPVGTEVHNIEFIPGRGGKMVRAAGQSATLRSKDGEYAQIKLPSGEVRLVHLNCLATIGQVGNLDHMNVSLGKAGKKRYKGFRPHVRGVVQNPVDHPMGGGEGRSSGGGHPVSPWGQLAKGLRTRKPKKPSKKFIVERRSK